MRKDLDLVGLKISEMVLIKFESTSKDEMILFGLSYWHVDRNEIDEILLSMDNKMEVRFVNPNPPTALEAVLTSLFRNYIHFSKGKLIMEECTDGN